MMNKPKARSRLNQRRMGVSQDVLREFLNTRKPYLPATVLGFTSLGIVVYILLSITPRSIADAPFPKTYGLLLLSVGISAFLLSSVAFLNRRRAMFFTSWLLITLALKVQQFSVSLEMVLSAGLILLLIEVIITRLSKRA